MVVYYMRGVNKVFWNTMIDYRIELMEANHAWGKYLVRYGVA